MNKLFLRINIILFLTGFIISFPFGFMGIMPLDQSYIFEGASKLYFGEKLFSDFYIPFAFVPVYIQFLLFKVFGITWWSYVFHAVVFNGLFTVLSYRILSLTIENSTIKILVSIVASFLFYPLAGTPMGENHAIYFSLLSFYFLMKAIDGNPKPAYYIAPLLLLAFLSKQNPTTFIAIIMGLFAVFNFKKLSRHILLKLSIGMGATIFLSALFLWSVDSEKFIFYVFQLPRSLVEKRMGHNPLTFELIADHFRMLGLHAVFIIPVLITSVTVLWKKDKKLLLTNLVFGMLFLLIFFASIMTQNQSEMYMPVTIIIFSVMVLNMVKPFAKKPGKAVMIIFAIILLFDFSINTPFIFQRRYNDLVFSKESFSNYNEKLGFYFQTPSLYNLHNEDINGLFDFIENNEGNFLYVGDLLIVNGLTENISPLPAVFYHQGVAQPIRYTPEFHKFNLRLYKKMREFNTKYIVIENAATYSTWLQMSVYDFFQRDYIESLEVIDLGYFHVLVVDGIP